MHAAPSDLQSCHFVYPSRSRARLSFSVVMPNPAFKRTHTGGAGLWVSRALRAPVPAA